MNVKLTVALALATALVVFTVQNAAVVEVDFLVWRAELPRAAVLFGFLLAGILIGWIARGVAARRARAAQSGKLASTDARGERGPGTRPGEDRS